MIQQTDVEMAKVEIAKVPWYYGQYWHIKSGTWVVSSDSWLANCKFFFLEDTRARR
jgi:hypothetical protein